MHSAAVAESAAAGAAIVLARAGELLSVADNAHMAGGGSGARHGRGRRMGTTGGDR